MQINDIFRTVNHFKRQIPVDVEGLALALGIKVKKLNLQENISGKIQRFGGDDHFMIAVNEHHSETRRRFTIAHELGHFVLHRHLIGEGVTDNAAFRADGSTGNPNIRAWEETEANRFAANLLMPTESVNYLRRVEHITDAEVMAKRLGVSRKAMEIRLSSISSMALQD